ncbi:MAG: MBL fold metallo-hydrolase [Maledivibacter sp.]|jgi:7,8-dihydropterin-6-yl-methyl-4-(beta-D-ribofuranosyl)aminobenzene 5'-phosphate synthase|nr:MBL fold metallo-hydrolase [Maledivibacter sp.]
MKVEILNLYSNESEKGSGLKNHHGQSFLISIGKERILFDTGQKSNILFHNMNKLNISPNHITKMVLSHGHVDHTGALPDFLDKRTKKGSLPLFAHPDFSEDKIFKMLFMKMPLGCPKLTQSQRKKLDFQLSKQQQQIAPYLKTTGEITERNELDGLESRALHWENNNLVVDPILDDLTLVLSAKDGEVIIAGCAHSGILNICNHVKKSTGRRIKAIIGGTHMVSYTHQQVMHVGDILENTYDLPDLYLNHCTDKMPAPFTKKTKTIDILKKRFGEEKVKKCNVGTKITFECV